MIDTSHSLTEGKDPRQESGQPGGGQGRTDEVGRTGVWPGSGPWPAGNVPIQQPGSFGQGERGDKGYEDSGQSSLEAIQAMLHQPQAKESPSMFVRDIMTQGVECIGLATTIHDAAKKMRDLDVGPLPVCGDNDRLVGIITDRDITIRAIAEGKDPRSTTVREVMTPGIIYCFDDQDVAEAARLMEEKQVRRIAVLNRNKRLVGIVSLGDLVVKTGDDELAAEAIEAISEPVHH